MTQRRVKQLKAEYIKMSQVRTQLLQRIQAAEEDLEGIPALLEEYKRQGRQQDFEELDNYYQQAYPDYTKLLRQLAATEDELKQLATLLRPFCDYFRDTGFLPGLE